MKKKEDNELKKGDEVAYRDWHLNDKLLTGVVERIGQKHGVKGQSYKRTRGQLLIREINTDTRFPYQSLSSAKWLDAEACAKSGSEKAQRWIGIDKIKQHGEEVKVWQLDEHCVNCGLEFGHPTPEDAYKAGCRVIVVKGYEDSGEVLCCEKCAKESSDD